MDQNYIYVGIWLGNNHENFQLDRFTKSENIAVFRGGSTFWLHILHCSTTLVIANIAISSPFTQKLSTTPIGETSQASWLLFRFYAYQFYDHREAAWYIISVLSDDNLRKPWRRRLKVHICTSGVSPGNTGQVRIWRSSGQEGQGHKNKKVENPYSRDLKLRSPITPAGSMKDGAMRFACIGHDWSNDVITIFVSWPEVTTLNYTHTHSQALIRYLQKTWSRKFIFTHPVYLQGIRVTFVHEGHRVKVEVTEAKRSKMRIPAM